MDNTEVGLRERIKRLRKAQGVLNIERRRIAFRYAQLKASSEKVLIRWREDSTLYGSMRVRSCPASCTLLNAYRATIFQCNMKDVVYSTRDALGRLACATCLFDNEEVETLVMMKRVKGK